MVGSPTGLSTFFSAHEKRLCRGPGVVVGSIFVGALFLLAILFFQGLPIFTGRRLQWFRRNRNPGRLSPADRVDTAAFSLLLLLFPAVCGLAAHNAATGTQLAEEQQLLFGGVFVIGAATTRILGWLVRQISHRRYNLPRIELGLTPIKRYSSPAWVAGATAALVIVLAFGCYVLGYYFLYTSTAGDRASLDHYTIIALPTIALLTISGAVVGYIWQHSRISREDARVRLADRNIVKSVKPDVNPTDPPPQSDSE